MTRSQQYVYALTRADVPDLDTVEALDGQAPVTLAVHDDIAAVISSAPVEALAALAAPHPAASRPEHLGVLARRHDAVVRAVHERAAVLPLRFGTVLADTDAVHTLLRRTADRARSRLDRVDGHAEWGVRISASSGSATATGPAAPGTSGTAYLARRRAELTAAAAAGRTAAHEAAAVHAELAPLAREHLTRPGSVGDDLLLDIAYLVPADGAAFQARIAELAARPALLLQLTGPWPPYSFVTGIDVAGAEVEGAAR